MAHPIHPPVTSGGLRPLFKWLRFLFYFIVILLFCHTIVSLTPSPTTFDTTTTDASFPSPPQQKQSPLPLPPPPPPPQYKSNLDFPWYKTPHSRWTQTNTNTFSTSHLTSTERHQLQLDKVAEARHRAKMFFDRITPPIHGIPGTSITHEGSAQLARQRIDCWTQGEWQPIIKPRHDLLQHIQDPLYSTCDKRFYKTHSEHIPRPETQYEWQHTRKCPTAATITTTRVLPKPTSRQWCRVLNGRHTLLVGDLVQYQLHELFLDSLRDGPTVCFGELNCKDHTLCSEMDSRLRYLRNDILADNRKHLNIDNMNGGLVAWPFVPSNILKLYSILILNRSPVVEDDDTFITSLINTLAYIRRTVPDMLIIYRSSGMGHPYCDDADQPLTTPLTDDEKQHLPFGWSELERRDAMARVIVEQAGGIFVDLANLVATRPDGHVGGHDCLRYCIPGPLDTWMDIIYQTLATLG